MALQSLRAKAPLRVLHVGRQQTELRIRQHFMDTPVEQARGERRADLTGLRLWPVSLRLMDTYEQVLAPSLRKRQARRGQPSSAPLQVLELSAGVGALGLGIAALGNARVVMTDPNVAVNLSEESTTTTLEWLRQNLLDNSSTLGAALPEVRPFEWNHPEHAAAINAEFAMPWDLVIGSDLLYDPDQYPALARTFCELMRDDETLGVLGFPHRHGAEKRFVEQMDAIGEFEMSTEWHAAEGDASEWAVIKMSRRGRPVDRMTSRAD